VLYGTCAVRVAYEVYGVYCCVCFVGNITWALWWWSKAKFQYNIVTEIVEIDLDKVPEANVYDVSFLESRHLEGVNQITGKRPAVSASEVLLQPKTHVPKEAIVNCYSIKDQQMTQKGHNLLFSYLERGLINTEKKCSLTMEACVVDAID
jgi:hypothetical protein